jgi:hypothetical protein
MNPLAHGEDPGPEAFWFPTAGGLVEVQGLRLGARQEVGCGWDDLHPDPFLANRTYRRGDRR